MTDRRIDYFDDPDAPRPTRIVPAVAVAVVNDAGQLLMIRRTDNDQWAIPGGKQELGETPMEAGRREVREDRRPGWDLQQPAQRGRVHQQR
jgi:8-oxo-dGTP pyrophosphatase MutT (NUDIX family)